jgi:hypothetical protein
MSAMASATAISIRVAADPDLIALLQLHRLEARLIGALVGG